MLPLCVHRADETGGCASAQTLTCGRWEHYHQVTDTPEKLDYPKIAASARWLTGLTRALCARSEPSRYVPQGTDDAGTERALRHSPNEKTHKKTKKKSERREIIDRKTGARTFLDRH